MKYSIEEKKGCPEDQSYSEEERIFPQGRKEVIDNRSPTLMCLLLNAVGFGFAEFEWCLQEGRKCKDNVKHQYPLMTLS